ncbi:MAG: hypothetical protein V1691_02460 [Chloroflexota bacterium]
MPGKARHGKGRFQPQSKKGKAKQRQATAEIITATTPAMAQDARPAPSTAPTPAKSNPAQRPGQQYPYVKAELRRISILFGIILVILIVLAIFLS